MKMKPIFFLVCLLVCLLVACRMSEETETKEGTTMDDSSYYKIIAPTRPAADELLPEIEKNKELIMNAIPIDEDNALRCAEVLYSFCVPELAEVTIINHDDLDFYTVQVVGTDNVTYYLIMIRGAFVGLYKEGENGREVLFGPGGPD